ncbi:MAG TPA: winged helix-turn-helix domain-containing protein [Ramlibacter sp.]|nr:winged helix-turn-helix domain-containing protein [Ramlibacter sp.]
MNTPGERTLKVGDGLFDPLRGELVLGGRNVKLRPRTAVLLSYLVQHPGRTLGKDELMQAVWPDAIVTEDSLVQCVKEIRQALGEAGRDWIRTLPRLGYAFVADSPSQLQPAAAPPVTVRWRLAAAFGLLAVILAGVVAWRFVPVSPGSSASAPPRSFVVLPIVNLTGDPAQDRPAEDMTEAITDTFGRGSMTVVAPSTASTYKGQPVDVRSLGATLNVRYVVQGALRMDGTQPVLTVRMADASTAVQLWQQELRIGPGWSQQLREDRDGITTALINAMRTADARRSGNPGAIKAAELVSRARDLLRGPPSTTETERQLQVQALVEEALRNNDQLASAWSLLAWTYMDDVRFSPDRARKLKRAVEAAERSVKLAPTSVPATITRGWVFIEEGRLAQALKTFERAIELNPKDAWGILSHGYGLLHLGRAQEALESVRQAMRLSPNDPKLVRWHTYEGMALLHLGQDTAAVQSLTHGLKATPPAPFAHLYLASALALAGRIEEARAQVAQFPQLYPGVTLSRWRALEVSDAPEFLKQRERVYEGLRRAGMPE